MKMQENFEIFISFKDLDNEGKSTRDSVMAREIYEYFTSRGFSVFFSKVSLEALGISAYKRAIDQALDTAQVLIVVGTSVEYLTSEWVYYEWDSFFNDIISRVKPEGKVFVYLENVAVGSLPRALRQSQAIFNSDNSLEKLFNFVANAAKKKANVLDSESDDHHGWPASEIKITDQGSLPSVVSVSAREKQEKRKNKDRNGVKRLSIFFVIAVIFGSIGFGVNGFLNKKKDDGNAEYSDTNQILNQNQNLSQSLESDQNGIEKKDISKRNGGVEPTPKTVAGKNQELDEKPEGNGKNIGDSPGQSLTANGQVKDKLNTSKIKDNEGSGALVNFNKAQKEIQSEAVTSEEIGTPDQEIKSKIAQKQQAETPEKTARPGLQKVTSSKEENQDYKENSQKNNTITANNKQVATITKPGPSIALKKTHVDEITNMEFTLIPGGCFKMGDNFGDGLSNERPVHEVCVSSFYMGKFEVTQGQYQAIVGNNPSNFKKGENFPVEMVSWNDAKSFIHQINQKSGKKYRLPTEAEWEYAARAAGSGDKYAGGNDINTVSWNKMNSGSSTHPVGMKTPNSFGLYDMTGNVAEWCEDYYDSAFFSSSPKDNPRGPTSGGGHVSRGSSWYDGPAEARVVSRNGESSSNTGVGLGFRLVFPVP